VKVTRGTNNCTTQGGGVPTGGADLWDGSGTGNGYNQKLWYSLDSLDEMNLGSGGTGTVRRFPANGGAITIYVRGGAQVLDWRIGMVRNVAGHTHPTSIIVRGYPGEWGASNTASMLQCGHPLITSGPYTGRYDTAFKGGGQYQFRVRRPNIVLECLRLRGYRTSGSDRIYCGGTFYHDGTDVDNVTPLSNFTIRKMWVNDTLGTASGTYRDAAFSLRSDSYNNVSPVDSLTINGGIVRSNAPNTLVEDMVCEVAPADLPMDANQKGEGIILLGTNSMLRRVTITGTTPHNGLGIGGNNSTIEHCDVENYHDTPIGVGGAGQTIRYNRIHMLTHESKLAIGIQVTPGAGTTTSGSIYGNAVWGWQFNGGAASTPNYGLSFSTTLANTFINPWDVYDNIFYGCGVGIFDNGFSWAVTNIDLHDNVHVDLPLWNKNIPAAFDCLILVRLVANDLGTGNKIRNNLLYRTDGGTQLVGVGFPTDYHTLAELNTLPNCTGNISADPLFSDPANGDFTLVSSDSPVYGWFDENVPLVPFVEEDLLDGVCPV